MQKAYVNVDCANIYKEGSYRSAIVSQAILWEEMTINKQESQFSQVICEDGYEGWISNNQLNTTDIIHTKERLTDKHVYVYDKPDEKSKTIREAGIGSDIPVLRKDGDWKEIILPDGPKGWIKAAAFKHVSGNKKNILQQQAVRFLGVPYFWGGKTAKGLDCSGFVQLLHKLAGIKVRRDSPMQGEDATMVSENFLDGSAGDLLFFAENGDRITHVALKLNEKEIIHARGRVRINNLDKNSADFDPKLMATFVAVKTFLSN